jgi:hypothetical protein
MHVRLTTSKSKRDSSLCVPALRAKAKARDTPLGMTAKAKHTATVEAPAKAPIRRLVFPGTANGLRGVNCASRQACLNFAGSWQKSKNGRRGENPGGRFLFFTRGERQGDSLSSLLYNYGISVRILHDNDFRTWLRDDTRGCGRFRGSFLLRIENGLTFGHRAIKWKVARGNEGAV